MLASAPQCLDRQAEQVERAGFQVLHEHVGPGDQGSELVHRRRLPEIECHGFLAAVEPDEIGAAGGRGLVVESGEITFRPLDLDHPCAGIGEAGGAERGGHGLLDGDDEQACKRQIGHQ